MKKKLAKTIFSIFALILVGGILSFPIRWLLVELGMIYHNEEPYILIKNKISEAMEQPICFYSATSDSYEIPNVSFGLDVSATMSQLGVDKLPDIEDPDTSLQGSDTAIYIYSNDRARICLFNNDCVINYYYTIKSGCYMLKFSTALIEPDGRKLHTESEAYYVVNDVFDKLFKEYGEPSESNYSKVRLESMDDYGQISEPVYAIWMAGEPTNRSYMVLKSYKATGDSGNEIFLQLFIGIEIDGLDINEELNRLIS